MSKVPSDQKSQYVNPCTTFTEGVIGGQNLALLITPVRKVLQVYSFVFWIQHGKLHLTPYRSTPDDPVCDF